MNLRMRENMPDEKEFLEQVAKHQMTVWRDDSEPGANRHIRFMQPGNSNRWFEIVTWYHRLVITGDMGSWMFSRTPDMFEFFRTESEHNPGEDLKINPHYWGEKLLASEKGGHVQFSPDLFIKIIEGLMAEMDETEATPDFREAVKEEVYNRAHDGEHEAIRAAMEFEHEGTRPWPEFYEHGCKVFTYSYLWACYAIAWAIRQYDLLKANKLPCQWEVIEPGLNLGATSLTPGDTEQKKWVLYSRGEGDQWVERTKPLAAPSADYKPVSTPEGWFWKTK